MISETTIGKQVDLLNLQPAWRSYFVFYVAILIFGIGPIINPEVGISKPFGFLLAILIIFFVLVRKKTTLYRITAEEVLRETGWAGLVSKKSLPLREVAGLEVRRGAVHRLLKIGQIQFRSHNPSQPDLWWFGVDDPFAVKKKIEKYLQK